MVNQFVNIHTHRPTGHGVELRAAGVHPWNAARQTAGGTETGDQEAVQAIGEIGLDFAVKVDRAKQYEVFRAQLQLARAAGLPVVIHCVRAFEEVMRELARCEPRVVIFHGFIGSPEQAQKAVQRGYYLSFGERTFRSPKSLEAMRQTPLAQLFFETDDSPVAIEAVYARAAEALGCAVEELQKATLQNYERIFENG